MEGRSSTKGMEERRTIEALGEPSEEGKFWNRGKEGDRRWRRRVRDHRADSACLPFHFPPQDRQSRGKKRGKSGRERREEGN